MIPCYRKENNSFKIESRWAGVCVWGGGGVTIFPHNDMIISFRICEEKTLFTEGGGIDDRAKKKP